MNVMKEKALSAYSLYSSETGNKMNNTCNIFIVISALGKKQGSEIESKAGVCPQFEESMVG